ncbi:MAG: hypothetical protein JKY48_04490 [Flavobacteriales bacterium]|nr:hypothetical protein [Flavobacteriales bacterium]
MDLLNNYQLLSTTGAKGATVFELQNDIYLAIPQFSEDITGVISSLDSGNSDVAVLIYKWQENSFQLHQSIPSHGSRNVSFFKIKGRNFIAVSCLRSGSNDDYNIRSYSMIYEWDGNFFIPFQQFLTESAKNCYHFSIEDRHFLAIACGEKLDPNESPDSSSSSPIYEWNGKGFELFQSLPSMAGFNWQHTSVESEHYLIQVDGTIPSTLYKWTGELFESSQSIDKAGGRHALFFNIDDSLYMAFANLSNDSTIYRWNGNRFESFQTLSLIGGHSFLFFEHQEKKYLMSACYIGGTRSAPVTKLESSLYVWDGEQFELEENYTTYGGTGLDYFYYNNELFIVQSNSHTPEIQFAQDSYVFKFGV